MNKLIILGIAFILMFSLNLTMHGSYASLTPLKQIPITIYNSQNIATPNPFQQEIILKPTYSSGLVYNGSFANFEFTYSNGQVIPAWIEQNVSYWPIWLKLTSIPAYGSMIIYLDIFPLNDNLLSNSGTFGIGEAPELSPIYGKYDDGFSVFDLYDNFEGTSLNGAKWAYGGIGSITVDNGLYIKASSNDIQGYSYAYIITKSGFNPFNTVADFRITTVSGYWPSVSMTIGSSNNSLGYFDIAKQSGTLTFYFLNGSYAPSKASFLGTNNGLGEYDIASESWRSSTSQFYSVNYGFPNLVTYTNQTFNSYAIPSEVYYGVGIHVGGYNSAYGGTINVTWVDVRAFPPNGVMPSVYFNVSNGLSVSVFYPSGNANLTTNYTIIYPQYNATSEDLQFNSEYFSFIIDPLFIFSLLIFLSLIFVIFMAIAVVKRKNK